MATSTLSMPGRMDGTSDQYALVVPLTDWNPPSGCSSVIQATDVSNSCGPPEMLSVWSYGGFYSPAICPRGYSTDCARTTTDAIHPFHISAGQTVASCIPSGYTCPNGVVASTNMAFRTIGATTLSVPALEIRWDTLADVTPTTGATITSRSFVKSSPKPEPPVANANSSSSGISAMLSTMAVSATTAGVATPTNVVETTSGPSTSIIIGIAVGGAFLALLVIGLLMLFVARRRHQTSHKNPYDSRQSQYELSEIKEPPVPLLAGEPIAELEHNELVALSELPAEETLLPHMPTASTMPKGLAEPEQCRSVQASKRMDGVPKILRVGPRPVELPTANDTAAPQSQDVEV